MNPFANYQEIVFVCTGNTCRSPMAEALLRNYISPNTQVRSAGLMVFGEVPANPKAVEVMARRGIDITEHRSKPLEFECCQSNTLILTMTKRHKAVLIQRDLECDIYTIKEFAGGSGDIEDPYGGTFEQYEACAKELDMLIQKIGGYEE